MGHKAPPPFGAKKDGIQRKNLAPFFRNFGLVSATPGAILSL
jgi:hypothetical protein